MASVVRVSLLAVLRNPVLLVVAFGAVLLAAIPSLLMSLGGVDFLPTTQLMTLGLLFFAQPLVLHVIANGLYAQAGSEPLPLRRLAQATVTDFPVMVRSLLTIVVLFALGGVFFGLGLLLTAPWSLLVGHVMVLRGMGGKDATVWLRDKLGMEALVGVSVILGVAVVLAVGVARALELLIGDAGTLVMPAVGWLILVPMSATIVLATHQDRKLTAA